MRKLLWCVLFIACDANTQQRQLDTLPLRDVPALKDCVYVKLDPGGTAPILHVVRCPSAVTTNRTTVENVCTQ
jgi:hypothetical protein